MPFHSDLERKLLEAQRAAERLPSLSGFEQIRVSIREVAELLDDVQIWMYERGLWDVGLQQAFVAAKSALTADLREGELVLRDPALVAPRVHELLTMVHGKIGELKEAPPKVRRAWRQRQEKPKAGLPPLFGLPWERRE